MTWDVYDQFGETGNDNSELDIIQYRSCAVLSEGFLSF